MRDERHPGTIYFYSDAIGLGSNAACAMIMSLHNLGGVGGSAEARGCTLLAVGGVAQLLCAARSFRGERTLPRTYMYPLAASPPSLAPASTCCHRSSHTPFTTALTIATVSTTRTAQHTTTSLRRR